MVKIILTVGAAFACLSAAELAPATRDEEIALLRSQIAAQQAQIEVLRKALDDQEKALTRLAGSSGASPSPVAGIVPQATVPVAAVAAAPQERRPTLGGFDLSGEFRFRLDVQARSGNEAAAPLQNARSRYRLRLNVDKQLDPRFRFHMQLSTGPYHNPVTADQDMAGGAARHPFSISEAWVDFRANHALTLRGGRMQEVFADNSRFLWDDDVRFNGFEQTLKLGLPRNTAGFTAVEFRAGEYILSNPAVSIISPSSPYIAAGYEVGQKVRSSNLFHPGFILRGSLGELWAHDITADVQVYRNPNQIQLSSTAAGYAVMTNGGLGLQLSGPISGTGNATTTPGGAMYSAPSFHIARVAYRLNRKPFAVAGKPMPAYLDFQAARNFGANGLRDAFMITGNLGVVRNAGDLRFLYQYAIKDANSIISQFTDDNLGTGSGVNIAAHGMRVDLGLTRFLQLQNLFFLVNPRRASNPAEQFFVPVPRGANATLRVQGQLAFSF